MARRPTSTDTKLRQATDDGRLVLEYVPISQVVEDPENARKHTAAQINLIAQSISDVRFVDPLIVDERMMVIGGHGRLAAARKLGMEEVPVVKVGGLSPEKRRWLQIALNQIPSTSSWDLTRLEHQLRDLADADLSIEALGFSTLEVYDLFHVAEKQRTRIDDIRDQPTLLEGAMQLDASARLSSSNDWGIPDLREDRLLDGLEEWDNKMVTFNADWPQDGLILWNVHQYSTRKLDIPRSIVGFWTDDQHFESFWGDPAGKTAQLINAGFKRVLEPDFSTWIDMPRVVQIHQIYRRRWMGRFFQEAGLTLMPALAWSDERSHEFCHLGIPTGAPVVGVQMQQHITVSTKKRCVEGLTAALETVRPRSVVIYTNPSNRQIFADTKLPCDVIFLDTFMGQRGRSRKGKASEQKALEAREAGELPGFRPEFDPATSIGVPSGVMLDLSPRHDSEKPKRRKSTAAVA